ncbi:SNF2 helicase associated domain-containing protein [Sporosarcina highlanderae]|uniref:SNF2 helicase associated domain-containing protein n=1 Tax=Sporosarcina highlanderae TaxID=3035916 RepID=A0ABT8JNJ5_9BACL|nr:SNF2 helicase associated domain-containing protein [Sporosarcina highlanderae]MDN4606713.1 SNF2 helicase associated domain-containing protein [Sporosarcina highlanderae]
MGIHLTQNKIMDLCGSVSFKRGEMYYRAGKVILKEYNDNYCKAIVEGKENFHVTIDFDNEGEIRTECSCPTLPFYRYKCQHVAAVLIAMNEQVEVPTEQSLTEGLLSLFDSKPRSSGHQLHFEDREVLELTFILSPVPTNKGFVLGIDLQIEGVLVEDVCQFLEDVNEGRASSLNSAFMFDTNLHCFKREADAVLQRLIEINKGAYTYRGGVPRTLVIPPSAWEKVLSDLNEAPEVYLKIYGKPATRLQIQETGLPVKFHFEKRPEKGHFLKIDGLDHVLMLQPYNLVLCDLQLFRLSGEDCKRLADLQQMVETSGTHQLPIANEQIGFFIEKVVPGLRRIGEVQVDETVLDQLVKSPLNAKLYMDRVNNRLLASLEFQYDHIVINPLIERELPATSVLVRDLEKEEEILRLMEESSFAQTDEGYLLHNEELEYEFLYNVLPKLEKLVRVYATTAIRIRIFRGSAKPRIRVKAFEEKTNWLEFKFSMDGIPDKQIRGILEALEEKRKYYRLRSGTLLSLETREFKEIRRFMNEVPGELDDLEKGLNMPITRGLRFLGALGGDELFAVEESARNFLERLLNPGKSAWDIPSSLETILRDYQKNGFKWMKTIAEFGVGGVLADDMGLGKTLQSIAFIVSELPKIRDEKQQVLIICPSSLTYNWLSELKKFAPEIEAVVLDGNKKERAERQADAADKDVLITSYPLIRKDIAWYEKQNFHTVFFDEAQAFKNPFTQTARSVKKLRATHRFALTGTPIENALEELWSIFHVVFPELFMGLREFSELSRKTVARRIRPFLLRRVKEDVLEELPDKVESIESSELLPEQKELYAAYLAKLRHDTLRHLDKDTLRKNKIRILAGLTRLRQICCHPELFVEGYEGSSAKYEQLKVLIGESTRAGRRVLIFSQFTKMLGIIGRDLAVEGTPFFYLDGSTPSEERLELCNRFNGGERDLFLISLKAGGTGLNLTGADTVILYDLWWNPAVEEQAADRAHRIGQLNAVHVIKLVARGTVEDKMNELQERKRDLISEVIDGEMGSMLTVEDIKDLLEI